MHIRSLLPYLFIATDVSGFVARKTVFNAFEILCLLFSFVPALPAESSTTTSQTSVSAAAVPAPSTPEEP